MSSAECHVHLVVNRLSACRKFLGCIVGKMAGRCECVVVLFASCLAGF